MFKIEKPARATRLLASAGFIVAVACAGSALAQSPPSGGKEQGRRGPPQEAVAACKSLSTGDACSFTARETHQGTCQVLMAKPASEGTSASAAKPLACRPSDAPDPGGRDENRRSR